MAAPTDGIESVTLNLIVDNWRPTQTEQIFPIQRINGFPWRLRIFRNHGDDVRYLSLICDKSEESVLWQCTATVTLFVSGHDLKYKQTLNSWDERGHRMPICRSCLFFNDGSNFNLKIEIDNLGMSWRLNPVVDFFALRDRTLVIGEEKKMIHVNKESMASQSSFFERLFFADFKERNMIEISIGDVEYEEFFNVLTMFYGLDGIVLSDENIHRIMQLADRFDLKIVEDRCINYLLSPCSSISLQEKLLISEQYNLSFLRDILLSRGYSNEEWQELNSSAELEHFSAETVRVIVEKCGGQLT